MEPVTQDGTKNCHLAQLRNAVINFSNPKMIKRILSTGIDINHKFHCTSPDGSSVFSTALHLAADKRSVTNFKTLLEHGADPTIKDSDGLTALHRGITLSDNVGESYENPFVDFALSAQVASNNAANPRDDRGFTHFHAACVTNDAHAVEFFLRNGVPVDQAMNRDSPLFPGYAPLHFAARFASLETAELLIAKGANAKLTDARGMTPLHVLIERKIAMLEFVDVKKARGDDKSVEALLMNIEDNEKILTLLLLLLDSTDDDIGMTKHHAICTLQKSSVAVSLLEDVSDVHARVKVDSPIWAGYTMLHFAAHCNSNMVRWLVDEGADIRAKDANGVTPLDIFVKWCSLRDLHSILSTDTLWSEVSFSDGKTKLLDCILAMESLNKFKTFVSDRVDIYLPTDSPLWPGSTLLHLSVMFAEQFAVGANLKLASESTNRASLQVVKACRDFGVSIYARDVRGRTPLHLAFRLNRVGDESRVLDMLLRCHQDCADDVDDENLSLLHIACAMRNKWMIEEWLQRDSQIDVNIVYEGSAPLHNVEPGWTPLHVAVASNADSSVAKMLLDHGADPYRVDANNFTPIHHLLLASSGSAPNNSCKRLLSLPDLRESDVAAAAAFTHLHVASYFDHVQAVDRLLDLGANVDAVSSLPRFENCTPLHLAMTNKSVAVVDVLVRRGADVLARWPNGSTPLSEVLASNKHSRSLNTFVGALRSNQELRRRVEAELGLTILHAVCRAGHVDAVKDLLSRGADVNAKMRDDAPFWPGWTPLHVLVTMGIEVVCRKNQLNDFQTMLETLLEHGAEVTMASADGDTPLHLMLKKHPCDTAYFIMTSLLSNQKDFSVNPMNKDGSTHFHAACLANNAEAVEKFLAHAAVDVNRPIGYFAGHYAGSTPLHLALNSNSKRHFGIEAHVRVVDLLLKRKPDLRAGDDYAYTSIHVAADCDPSCLGLLEMLITNGADINSRTIDGKTAFEIILRSKEITVDDIEFFVKRQYRVNGCNPITDIGYLSIILNEKNFKLRADILKALMKAPNIVLPDEMGRTPIHNIVATNDLVISEHDYVEMVEKFAKLGCDVNEQDKTGMTALHLALLFRNKVATTALLICGVDVNIVDSRGKTAFTCALDPCTHCLTHCNTAHDYLLKVLVDHVHKLKLAGLYVSERNERMKALALENRWIRYLDLPTKLKFYDEKDKETGAMVIGPRGWTLHDFLKEYGAVNDYRSLTQGERTVIDQFFETVDYHSFRDLKYMLKVQYRHAVARGALFDPAIDSIKHLFGLPDLCAEAILSYLRNPDLKNLIEAADSDD